MSQLTYDLNLQVFEERMKPQKYCNREPRLVCVREWVWMRDNCMVIVCCFVYKWSGWTYVWVGLHVCWRIRCLYRWPFIPMDVYSVFFSSLLLFVPSFAVLFFSVSFYRIHVLFTHNIITTYASSLPTFHIVDTRSLTTIFL